MGIYLPIPTDSVFKEGSYRFTFSYPGGLLTPPDVGTPKVYALGGKKIVVTDWTKNSTDNTLLVGVTITGETSQDSDTINQAGIPIGFLLGALAAIVGLALVYLTLVKVEKLIDSPVGSIAILAGAALVFLILWKVIKK